MFFKYRVDTKVFVNNVGDRGKKVTILGIRM